MDTICAHRHRMILWTHSVAIIVERFHRSLYSNQNCIWINRNKSKNHRFLSHLIWIQTDTHTHSGNIFFITCQRYARKQLEITNHRRAAVCIYKMCKLSENVANQIRIPRSFASWHSSVEQIVYDCHCMRYLFVIFTRTLLATNGKYVLNRKWNASFTCLDDEDAWWMCDRIPSVQSKIEFYRKSDK